jgi:hypothetical protein
VLHLSFAFRRVLWISLMAAVSAISAVASETIVGVVFNETTGKPSAGDDVVLLTIDRGSLEVSRSKTARDGSFRLHTDVLGKHLLRARHDGVIYQQEVVSGIAPQLKVFDATSGHVGVREAVTITKIESSGESLNITELHSIRNDSSPPRTLANNNNLEILIPSKAVLDSIVVQGPSRPEKVRPKPIAAGSRQYALGYPLRPGTTQFAVKYHLLYSDRAVFHPRLQYPADLWTVVFPKSMNFRAFDGTRFHKLIDQQGMQVQAISKAAAGEVPGFVISGTGSLPQIVTPAVSTVSTELPISSHASSSSRVNILPRAGFLSGTQHPVIRYGIGGLILLLGISLARRLVSTRPNAENKARI